MGGIAAPGPGQAPLAVLLDQEGRLDLTSGLRGSIDARGWQLASGPNQEQVAVPLATEEGGQWSGIFEPRGMDDSVSALAVDGAGNLYAGGRFTMAGGVPANYIARWDGSAWSALGSGMSGESYPGVYALAVDGAGNVYAGGWFTTAGGVAANNIARWDGTKWSALGSGVDHGVYALAVDGAGNLYTGGRFTSAGGVAANNIAKWNGSAWSALGSGMGGDYPSVDALAVDGAGNLYAGGNFTTAGNVAANHIARWDGSAWYVLGSGMETYGVSALAVDSAGILYAGAYSTVRKWDGSAWSTLGSGTGDSVADLAVDGAGNLYAAADLVVKQWDGSVWSALGGEVSGGPDDRDWDIGIYALVVNGAGNLYAGGHFAAADGVAANHIANWDGSSWSSLGAGQGMNHEVLALVMDGASNLYAGGWFWTAGGAAANRIARWDGSAWSALGIGMDEYDKYVGALAVDGASNLYAGGWFYSAGGVWASHIARWDGSSWYGFGAGHEMNDNVWDLKMDGAGNLYAGGGFTTVGGAAMSYIAKWNGRAWSALGSGMNDGVSALAVDDTGTLYAGGYFTTAGGVAANRIAKWNGSAWSALGDGLGGSDNPAVYALALDGAGTLYVGGRFTSAGGVAANHIAKWNGSTWSALGSGMNDDVYALAVDGAGNVYAGGRFTTAGGVAASRIARWDGSAWSSLGSGVDDDVYALAVDVDGDVYAGGDFTTAGGRRSAHIGRWEFDRTLTLTKTGNGSGLVTSNPASIECGTVCSSVFAAGTTVTLMASPGAFSTFTGWSGACTGGGPCLLTMDANKAVTATFTLQTFPLTVSKAGIGGGMVASSPAGITCGAACSADFTTGTVVTLGATPNSGASFSGWSGACSGSGSCTITMDAPKDVTATFGVPGAVTPQASTMYYGQQLQIEGEAVAAAPAAVTKLVVFTGTVPAGIFLVGVEGSEPYAGEVSAGRLINRLLAEGCGTHGACTAVNVAVYAPDGTHTDFVATSPVITDHVYLPHVSRK